MINKNLVLDYKDLIEVKDREELYIIDETDIFPNQELIFVRRYDTISAEVPREIINRCKIICIITRETRPEYFL